MEADRDSIDEVGEELDPRDEIEKLREQEFQAKWEYESSVDVVRLYQEACDKCSKKIEYTTNGDKELRDKYMRRMKSCLDDLASGEKYRDECQAQLNAIRRRLAELQDAADDMDSDADSEEERVYPPEVRRGS